MYFAELKRNQKQWTWLHILSWSWLKFVIPFSKSLIWIKGHHFILSWEQQACLSFGILWSESSILNRNYFFIPERSKEEEAQKCSIVLWNQTEASICGFFNSDPVCDLVNYKTPIEIRLSGKWYFHFLILNFWAKEKENCWSN